MPQIPTITKLFISHCQKTTGFDKIERTNNRSESRIKSSRDEVRVRRSRSSKVQPRARLSLSIPPLVSGWCSSLLLLHSHIASAYILHRQNLSSPSISSPTDSTRLHEKYSFVFKATKWGYWHSRKRYFDTYPYQVALPFWWRMFVSSHDQEWQRT